MILSEILLILVGLYAFYLKLDQIRLIGENKQLDISNKRYESMRFIVPLFEDLQLDNLYSKHECIQKIIDHLDQDNIRVEGNNVWVLSVKIGNGYKTKDGLRWGNSFFHHRYEIANFFESLGYANWQALHMSLDAYELSSFRFESEGPWNTLRGKLYATKNSDEISRLAQDI